MLRYLRRHSLLLNVLRVQEDFETAFRRATTRFAEVRERNASLEKEELREFAEKWEEETPKRDAAIARVIKDCCFGTSSHVEGYLYATIDGRRARKYFVVADGRLVQFPDWGNYTVERDLELLLFSVKPVEGSLLEFEAQSPMCSFVFEAPSESKRNKWVSVLAENISAKLDAAKRTNKTTAEDDARKKEVLDAIRKVEGNNVCADCDAEEPTWISINYGIVICHKCSGVHRKIGSHMSKVRSLTLDVIDKELQLLMCSIGNARANAILECNLDRKKPSGASKWEIREEFITHKYVNRGFGVKSGEDPDTLAAILHDMFSANQEVSAPELLKFIVQGANLKWKHPESGETLLFALLSSNNQEDPFLLSQVRRDRERGEKRFSFIFCAYSFSFF